MTALAPLEPRPYAPGEKMTDRHPDSVIAQVVEETIDKRVTYLAQRLHKRAGYAPLPGMPQPEPVYRLTATDGALYVDTAHGPVKVSPAAVLNPAFVPPGPIPPELLEQRDRLMRETYERCGVDPAKLQKTAPAQPGKQWVTPVVYEQRSARADGFDQRQVDAARGALLAPAPPRYPSRNR